MDHLFKKIKYPPLNILSRTAGNFKFDFFKLTTLQFKLSLQCYNSVRVCLDFQPGKNLVCRSIPSHHLEGYRYQSVLIQIEGKFPIWRHGYVVAGVEFIFDAGKVAASLDEEAKIVHSPVKSVDLLGNLEIIINKF